MRRPTLCLCTLALTACGPTAGDVRARLAAKDWDGALAINARLDGDQRWPAERALVDDALRAAQPTLTVTALSPAAATALLGTDLPRLAEGGDRLVRVRVALAHRSPYRLHVDLTEATAGGVGLQVLRAPLGSAR